MKLKFKGLEVNTNANLPKKKTKAPEFCLVDKNLSIVSLSDFRGKRVILNIFPSLDTETCATSVRKFNMEAAKLPNTVVLCISKDLPFAQKRFCEVEGIKNVIMLSEFRNNYFSTDYGVRIVDSPLQGLMARAVLVLDREGYVRYREMVQDIADEPNYHLVINSLEAITEDSYSVSLNDIF
ncbi:MAG: thiol peroxidase [Bacteroidales bacterium]|nr:thiol peroxidase [Bacteroidales bacterium]